MGVLASRVPLPQSSFEIKKTCPGTRTVIVEGRERLTNSYFLIFFGKARRQPV